MMSESIKKVEHADFVVLMSKDPVDDHIVHMLIGKNRSGKSGMPIDFKVDFSKFKFINGTALSNVVPPTDKANEQLTGFTDKSNIF